MVMHPETSTGPALDWFRKSDWVPQSFQTATWEACLHGFSGLLSAPTGTGKTYALLIPFLLEALHANKEKAGCCLLWITPIRALAREIEISVQRALTGLGLDWKVGVRTGDTTQRIRRQQAKDQPQVLITTPESLQMLFTQAGYPDLLAGLQGVVVDEWHELLGSKRGVQMQLSLAHLKTMIPSLRIWGISATLGNLEEAAEVLFGGVVLPEKRKLITAALHKEIVIHTLLPDQVTTYPWAGHLGIRLADKLLPLLREGKSTLIFTNTRAQCEIWYRHLLEMLPELAGYLAMHHGSMSRELRDWVEAELHAGNLRAVVCTSSLDLGVDFRPVETVIQVGSPKGIARFLQRAGRSGHRPGALSEIYFLPTHALEMLEGAALREAVEAGDLEARLPPVRCFDVLIQYLVTRALGGGFEPRKLFREVLATFAFSSLSTTEWEWVLSFVSTGGHTLQAYPEFSRIVVEEGIWHVRDREVALRHRLQMGTITSDTMMQVKYVKGGYLGSIEEWFIRSLRPGEVFWFAGQALSLVRIREMTALVRKSRDTKGRIPSWQGGRLPLSSELGTHLRRQIYQLADRSPEASPELVALVPLVQIQERDSAIPREGQFLVETFQSREGFHMTCYPLEGRLVHEGLGALIAWRLSRNKPQSFSIAMNDYGIEWLSDQPIAVDEGVLQQLFSPEELGRHLEACLHAIALAGRRFRDIAAISGLLFRGYPGKPRKERHLQASGDLFFQVFQEYEPDNLLLQQAFGEAMEYQLEENRLRNALDRVARQEILLKRCARATPFAFPIMVDRLREKLSSERLEDRIRKMTAALEKSV